MKPIVEGYLYELESFEGGEPQTLQFIHKEQNEEGALVTQADGTTNEELLDVLIHRLTHMHNKLPSRESALAITKVQEARLWLLARTWDRQQRKVEGTMEP